MLLINVPIAAAAAPFTVCSAARAKPAPGVPAAAFVAISAALTAVSAMAFAAWRALATEAGTPRHAGLPPMNTVGLPGEPHSAQGKGCVGWSPILAAIFIGKNFRS